MINQKKTVIKEVFDNQDIEKNRIYATLAYLMFFLPIVMDKNSRFGKFHANQGLNLLIVGLAGRIILGIILPFTKWLWAIAVIIFIVIGMKNAYEGKAEELPLIGSYRLLK